MQDSYRASGRQVVKGPLNTDRHMRQKDNKNTHFHLGFDKEDSISEQVGTCVHPVHKYVRAYLSRLLCACLLCLVYEALLM